MGTSLVTMRKGLDGRRGEEAKTSGSIISVLKGVSHHRNVAAQRTVGTFQREKHARRKRKSEQGG